MNTTRIVQALADITDSGLFERLATAILRKANPNYSSIVHTGVNARGTTVKSPVDGICFVQGADPPHMIVLHHTIAARRDLKKKWLQDPRGLNSQIGDLIKTAKLAAEERARTPNLCVTLVLTTNKEPDEALVRDVNAKGHAHKVQIDLWSCSRLADFLDNDPAGQWIRRKFLKIEQEQLSDELFHELSKKSLQIHKPISNPDTWISRTLDVTMMSSLQHDVTFLVGGSGLGKSVACYRRLRTHVENGGFGIVLRHKCIASVMTLDQAVERALRELHPSLSVGNTVALSFCSPTRPLLLVVEDINRSGQTQFLAERIAGWSQTSTTNDNNYHGAAPRWQLLCPLWPDAIPSMGDEIKKRIEPMIVTTGGFTKNEGREAVLTRARIEGRELSCLDAEETSHALGHDPLLIALHDPSKAANPSRTIGEFIDSSLLRVAQSSGYDHTASDYRYTLLAFVEEILANRQIEPAWNEIRNWPSLKEDSLRLLSHLVHQGEVIHLRGPSQDQRIFFRHDRVRDWLLADAVTELDRRNQLPEDILAEPFFAEVIGMALAWGRTESSFLKCVAQFNPLALFHALRLFGETTEPRHEFILDAINSWLESPTTHDSSNLYLRLEALAMLAETDSTRVPALVQKFHDRATSGDLARFRNGDLSGGIELCSHIEPGVSAPWRDTQIEHAKLRHGNKLTKALDEFIRREDLKESERIGALRLSGHIAAAGLAPAIEVCWLSDEERGNHLADYLWAFAQCCGDDPARYLGPVCNAWARLPEQSDVQGYPSPRHSLAADEICWAFRKWPPAKAINYFIERGSKDELRWPITYMLHGMDHPKAVVFVVQELAAIQCEDTDLFLPLLLFTSDDWRRLQKNENRPMSKASRDSLLSPTNS